MIESSHSILNSTLSKDALKPYEYGAPGEIRTPDLMVRSHALYPTELRARTSGKARDSTTRVFISIMSKWRRGRDSNPRWSYKPHTPLAGERLQPLGHLSGSKHS